MLLYGGNQVIDGAIQIGVLVGFLAALNNFFDPITQLSQLYTTYQSGMAALDKIFELLDEQPEMLERNDAGDARADPRRAALRARQLRLRAAATASEAALALDDIDLAIAPGETVALVGATGAGKSTFAKLVARFYDPTLGRVVIDGHDVRDVTYAVAALAAGHRPPGGVPVLGHACARTSPSARPDASDAEVEAAARAVGAHEFIASLEHGYDDARSASAAASSPPGSASSSRSLAR